MTGAVLAREREGDDDEVEVAVDVLLVGGAAGVGAELGLWVLVLHIAVGALDCECGFAVQLFC